MALELSRSEFPNGGWQFTQPQTGWEAPTPKSPTFDQTVVQIRDHRLGNPAIVAKHNLSTDLGSIAKELEAFTRTRLGMPSADTPVSAMPLPPGAKAQKCCGQA